MAWIDLGTADGTEFLVLRDLADDMEARPPWGDYTAEQWHSIVPDESERIDIDDEDNVAIRYSRKYQDLS
jgi:hypothetical protein